jgi:hypothetical protein
MSREKIGQKKSSTVSARQALELLLEAGYQTVTPERDRVVRPTERAAIRQNPDRLMSKSGKSIHLVFAGESNDQNRASELFVPAKGMLSQNEVTGIETRAKIRLINPDI